MDKKRNKYRFIILIGVLLLVIYIYINYTTIFSSNNSTTESKKLLLSPPIAEISTKTDFYSEGKLLHGTPNEGFVTFSDNNPTYLALLKNLLDSVHNFSTRPVIAYGIDVDLNLDTKQYPRLIKRRLKRSECGPSIYFCKIFAIVESKLDYGVHLEADSVVNWNVDDLFDVIHKWPHSYPLAPRHPDDPVNYGRYLNKFGLTLESRTTPYIHAQFSWNYRSYPFFQEALTLMRKGEFMGANYDETAINILLWKAKAKHTLCKIDPYFGYLPAYETQTTTCREYCHTGFILIHGSKEPKQLYEVFQKLKKYAGLPYIQTKSDGFHYLNETKYTCCYPDSKRSSIHPLICEYSK